MCELDKQDERIKSRNQSHTCVVAAMVAADEDWKAGNIENLLECTDDNLLADRRGYVCARCSLLEVPEADAVVGNEVHAAENEHTIQ